MEHQRFFREHHLLTILKLYEQQPYPLDSFLRNYFKLHRSAGSKDRKWICDTLYGMIRWKGLIDHFCTHPIHWEQRYQCFQTLQPSNYFNDQSIPAHIRVSFPETFFLALETSLGFKKAWDLCMMSNETAPTTIRINPIKTSRDQLLQRWGNQFSMTRCPHSLLGITFHKKENFFALSEFKEGLFEVQDEASQLIADLVNPKPSQLILDYCAGSGGKTLAFAHKMEGRGQMYLHDIRPHALQEAKKRLYRAGIQNAQVLLPDAPHKNKLKGLMDWVLVDAPCTGTGTLRRNPDMKWKFDSEMIARLALLQKEIVKEALTFLKPNGHLVYSTCSVLPEENEHQIKYFEQEHQLQTISPPLQTFPQTGSMDGFFGAVLRTPKK